MKRSGVKVSTYNIAVIIVTALLLTQVQSYSSATVHNDGKVSFVSSETSLIAMPEEIKVQIGYSPDTMAFGLAPEELGLLPMEVISSNFIITNNTDDIVTIKSFIEPVTQGIMIDNSKNPAIFPGESYELEFIITSELPGGEMEYKALIYAEWENGKAEIEKDFTVEAQILEEISIIPEAIVPQEAVQGAGSSGGSGLNFEKPEEVVPENTENVKNNEEVAATKENPDKVIEEEKPKTEESPSISDPVSEGQVEKEKAEEPISEPEKKTETKDPQTPASEEVNQGDTSDASQGQ